MSKQAPAPASDTLSSAELARFYTLGYKKAEALAMTLTEARALLQANQRKPVPLSPEELVILDLLGYTTPEHLDRSLPELRAIIKAKTYRAGSRAFNEAQGSPLPDRLTDDAIIEANAVRPVASGIEVRVDEYTQACVRGDDPLDALLLQCQDAYPNDVIRLINPDLPQSGGPAFQQIYDTKGTPLGTGGLQAMRMPKAVYNDFYVKKNAQLSQNMMSAVTDTRPIGDGDGRSGDTSVPVADRHYSPVQGQGLTIAPNLANL